MTDMIRKGWLGPVEPALITVQIAAHDLHTKTATFTGRDLRLLGEAPAMAEALLNFAASDGLLADNIKLAQDILARIAA